MAFFVYKARVGPELGRSWAWVRAAMSRSPKKNFRTIHFFRFHRLFQPLIITKIFFYFIKVHYSQNVNLCEDFNNSSHSLRKQFYLSYFSMLFTRKTREKHLIYVKSMENLTFLLKKSKNSHFPSHISKIFCIFAPNNYLYSYTRT